MLSNSHFRLCVCMQVGTSPALLLRNLSQMPAQEAGLKKHLLKRLSTPPSAGKKRKKKKKKVKEETVRKHQPAPIPKGADIQSLAARAYASDSKTHEHLPSSKQSTTAKKLTRAATLSSSSLHSSSFSSSSSSSSSCSKTSTPSTFSSPVSGSVLIDEVVVVTDDESSDHPSDYSVAKETTGSPKVSKTNSPSVISTVTTSREFASPNNASRLCDGCGANGLALGQCGRCKLARYCSRSCMRSHFPKHEAFCLRFSSLDH